MEITREVFEAQRRRRFGTSNPEPMGLAFWEAMVRGHEDARLQDWRERDPPVFCHPTSVRRFFGQEGDYSRGPIWTFERMGATRTPLPDGRMVCVAGEHEDHYDPDFCIYNDVVVLDLDGSVRIFGYPREVFPPTDFHTATPFGGRLILIGSLGYPEERRPGSAPVFALDLDDYRIGPLPSHGEAPGWISQHEAELSHGVVTVRGGQVWEVKGGEPRLRRNFDDYAYEVGTGLWTRLTHRRWRQYEIQDAGGKSFMKGPPFKGCCSLDDEPWKRSLDEEESRVDDLFVYVMPDALMPRSLRCEPVWSEEYSYEDRILVEGIPVTINVGVHGIEVVVEGDVEPATADYLAEDIRESVEEDTGRPCVLKKYD